LTSSEPGGRLIVLVLAVDRREDSAAYKAAVSRLVEAAVAVSKATATVSEAPVRKAALSARKKRPR